MKKLLIIFSAIFFSGAAFLANALDQPATPLEHPSGVVTGAKKFMLPTAPFNPVLAYFNVDKVRLTTNSNSSVKIEGKVNNNYMTIFGEGLKTSENILNCFPALASLNKLSLALKNNKTEVASETTSPVLSSSKILEDFVSYGGPYGVEGPASAGPHLPIAFLTGDKHVLFVKTTSIETTRNGNIEFNGVIDSALSNVSFTPNTTVKLGTGMVSIFSKNTRPLSVDSKGKINAQYKVGKLTGTQLVDIIGPLDIESGNSPFQITLRTQKR